MEEKGGTAGAADRSRFGWPAAGILDGIEWRTLPAQLSQALIEVYKPRSR